MLLMNRIETVEIGSDWTLVVDACEVICEIHLHSADFDRV
jgi:hypothetical protein